jgi:predicted nucleic acid-binding Zn ribbon protein
MTDFLNPHEQPQFECYECGSDMQEDIQYCSNACFESSMR